MSGGMSLSLQVVTFISAIPTDTSPGEQQQTGNIMHLNHQQLIQYKPYVST